MAVAVGAETVGQVARVKMFAAVFAPVIEVVEAVRTDVDFVAVATVDAVQIVFVVNFSTMLATAVRIVAAIVTNEHGVTMSVISIVHVVPVMNFATFSTLIAMILNAVRADVGIVNERHLGTGIILVAVAAIAEPLFKTVRANVNAFAVFVEDAGDRIGSAPTFVTSFTTFGVTLIAVETF